MILKPRSEHPNDPYAEASRQAMRAYAYSIGKENPEMAKEILDWVDAEVLFEAGLWCGEGTKGINEMKTKDVIKAELLDMTKEGTEKLKLSSLVEYIDEKTKDAYMMGYHNGIGNTRHRSDNHNAWLEATKNSPFYM